MRAFGLHDTRRTDESGDCDLRYQRERKREREMLCGLVSGVFGTDLITAVDGSRVHGIKGGD